MLVSPSRLAWGVLLAAPAVAWLSCSGASPTALALQEPAEAPPTIGSSGEQVLATYGVTLDLNTLSARVEPRRAGAVFQGITYDLDIDQFQDSDSFRILGIRVDGDGNPVVDFSHKHPFPAPTLTAPVTALNRADLGYTGRLVLLADVNLPDASQSFFTNQLFANTQTFVDADGYVTVGDLLANGAGYEANAFPYKLLVDELLDSREGVSNGGQNHGNYVAATGGWQGDNISGGSVNNGWTGFDYLHEGQTSRSSFTIARAAFENGSATFDAAILIKYTDPRGGRTRTWRFPQEPVNVQQFAYRLPHAAIDASKITATPLVLETTTGFSTTLTTRVRDWDAAALETTLNDIGIEPDVSRVPQGHSGPPAIVVSTPTLSDEFKTGNHTTPGNTGEPGDEHVYLTTIRNDLGTALPGTHWGMIRAGDPEDSAPNKDDYHYGVDPVTLAGSNARALEVATYQAVPITVRTPSAAAPSCGATGINGSGSVGPGGSFTVDLSSVDDPTNTDLDFRFQYTGPSSSLSSVVTIALADLPSESAFNPFTDPRLGVKLIPPTLQGTYELTITINDGESAEVLCGPYLFTVQTNLPPDCGIGVQLSQTVFFTSQTVDFTADLSVITDPGSPGPIAVHFAYAGPQNDITDVENFTFPLPVNFNPFSDPRLAQPLAPPTSIGFYTFSATANDGVNSPVVCTAQFEIRASGVCGNPMTDPDITAAPTFANRSYLNTTPNSWYNFYSTIDFAAFTDGTTGYVCQRYDDPIDQDNGPIENYDLWRFTTPGGTGTAVRLTNFFTRGDQVAQLEIDRANRLLYTFRPVDDDWSTETAYVNPNRLVHWVDYTGTTATGESGNFQLPNVPIALALGIDNSLWVIDRTNTLLHYQKSGGTYTLEPDDTVDLGGLLGIDSDQVVCDLVVNWHNGALYVLTNDGANRDGRLWRIECDGELWTGGTNPLGLDLSVGRQFAMVPDGGDLSIDQIDTSGVLLDGPQDAQIAVFHAVGAGGVYVVNAELQLTATSAGGTASGPRGVVVGVEDYALSNETDPSAAGEHWAWHDRWTLPAAWQ